MSLVGITRHLFLLHNNNISITSFSCTDILLQFVPKLKTDSFEQFDSELLLHELFLDSIMEEYPNLDYKFKIFDSQCAKHICFYFINSSSYVVFVLFHSLFFRCRIINGKV